MKTHELKTWPPFFIEVEAGRKPFEIRRDDRGYAVGDTLVLMEWQPVTQTYTGREVTARVSYVAHAFGLEQGFCVLGLMNVENSDPELRPDHECEHCKGTGGIVMGSYPEGDEIDCDCRGSRNPLLV